MVVGPGPAAQAARRRRLLDRGDRAAPRRPSHACWSQVLAIRFTDRVGKGIRTSPRDALLADLVPREKRGRAFGLQRAMDNAGALVGPLVAALPAEARARRRAHGVSSRRGPGPRRRRRPPPRGPDVRDGPARARHPRSAAEPLPRSLLARRSRSSRSSRSRNSTDAFLLVRAEESGVPLWQLPLLWAFFNGVKAVTGVPGGAIADRVGRVPAIAAGWIVYAAAYVGFAFVSGPAAVWGLFALYALFFG